MIAVGLIPVSVLLRAANLPATVKDVVSLLLAAGPDLREAVAALVRALQGGDDEAARRAYEAARRAAFAARQR